MSKTTPPNQNWRRAEKRAKLYFGSHITAKTHRTVPCVATAGALTALPHAVARVQMLKDRRNARSA